MIDPTARALVDKLRLKPHPEGGYYRETYRSEHSTAIYFLLPAGERSRLHRIKSDELWHFYAGGPLEVSEIAPDGRARKTRLGPEDSLQHVVPAGNWFGAEPCHGTPFSLVGCTVAPPFQFEGLEFGLKADLLARFPGARDTIERLADD